MSNPILSLPKLLELRTVVGFLGEKAQFAWWPTKFYEGSSRLFLDHPFPKTAKLAQYHGVLEAARKLHDEHLNVGNYHLFRLPEEIEQDLHIALQGDMDIPVAMNKDVALERLKQLAGDRAPARVGPTAVGDIKNIHSPAVLSAIAGVYFASFIQNAKSYPYLVE